MQIFAIGEAAVPFLKIHPSPRLNGMAGAVTGIPMNDPYAVYFNPAQLGYLGQTQNLSIGTYLHKTDWLPTFNFDDLTFNSSVYSAGYNFNNVLADLSISLALSYMDTELDLGENVWTDDEGNIIGTFSSDENYQMYSFGVGIDYYIQFYFGYSYKEIESNLAPMPFDSNSVKAEGNASDYGIIVDIPVVKILHQLYDSELLTTDWFTSEFSFSLGAALLNSGDFIKYSNLPGPGDPLPKTAKIGWGINIEFIGKDEYKDISLFKAIWGTEARDELIEVNEEIEWEFYLAKNYTDFPGNIKFWDNVMRGKATNDIYIYQGWQVGLFDTFEYSNGTWAGPGYRRNLNTSGFMVSTNGIFKYLKINNNSTFTWLADHIELQYQQSEYEDSQNILDGTTFRGISVFVKGF